MISSIQALFHCTKLREAAKKSKHSCSDRKCLVGKETKCARYRMEDILARLVVGSAISSKALVNLALDNMTIDLVRMWETRGPEEKFRNEEDANEYLSNILQYMNAEYIHELFGMNLGKCAHCDLERSMLMEGACEIHLHIGPSFVKNWKNYL